MRSMEFVTEDNYRECIKRTCKELELLGYLINRAYNKKDIEYIMKTQKEIEECNKFLGELLEFPKDSSNK
jgi:hypothetical protein